MNTDVVLAAMSAVEMREGFADGSLSPVEVHDAVQVIIEAREPVLNAFWRRDAESSRTQAKASEKRWTQGEPLGPIDGVPVTLKENIARAGVPMPSGTAGVIPTVPERDSPITERVVQSGGVVLGSTVMPDWGMLSSGVSSLHGITRSPWDPSLTTGGSSAGAGAAAAAGYGPLHVGTDIGGSIRLPGTWLGLTTLKPSLGRVPLDSPYPGRSAGPLCRSADDVALLMSIIAGFDPRDWTALPPADIAWNDLRFDPRGLKVGLQVDAGCGLPVDDEVRATVEHAATVFRDAGAMVDPLEPFISPTMLDELDTFWRVRSWHDYHRLSSEQKLKVLPFIVQWVHGGADVPGARVLECYQTIMTMQHATVAATERFDLVLSPVAPMMAFAAEWPMPFGTADLGMAHIGFTAPYNMSGQPAASVNAGFSQDGRAIGVQISGRRFDDLGVVRAARWFEHHRPEAARPNWPIHSSEQETNR
ncbi:amidase [Leekyejoonella antrihumi]|uniref:Amidase n=1 Tax=Leekyejoonella antrihumi TaxID=1660198 RepID=A0A563E0P0_9MICO|nr:amidase [Leekyejoonella antrihumi]TWP35793.1 amidase [Leekyejoonella antrihumi]